jgi:hypothetical protein
MTTEAGSRAIRPHPLSVLEMLRATLRIYRRGFVAFVLVMGVAAVPDPLVSAGYDVISGYANSTSEAGRSLRALATSLLVGLLSLLAYGVYSIIAEALFGGIAIVIASNTILGRPADVGAACRLAASRLGQLSLVTGVTWLVVLVLCVTVLGIPFAVYVGLGWMLASQVIVLEDLGWRDALRRSWGMARWNRQRLLAWFIGLFLVETILYNAPSCLFASVVGGGPWFQGCPMAEDAPMVVRLGDVVLRGLSSALFHSLVFVTITLLYYDFRVCDERLDLDLRAAVTDRPPTT